jgi:hypothetical protein
MTNSRDTLFAFQGVFAILQRAIHTECIAGLPINNLCEAHLCITPGDFTLRSIKQRDRRRSVPISIVDLGKVTLPSNIDFSLGS